MCNFVKLRQQMGNMNKKPRNTLIVKLLLHLQNLMHHRLFLLGSLVSLYEVEAVYYKNKEVSFHVEVAEPLKMSPSFLCLLYPSKINNGTLILLDAEFSVFVYF